MILLDYTSADLCIELKRQKNADIHIHKNQDATMDSEMVLENQQREAPTAVSQLCSKASRVAETIDFDETLKSVWDSAQESALFRYKFNANIPSKVISAKYKFIAQLNPDRASKRRKPQEMSSLSQPFNSTEFNFNKVKPEEMVMTLKPGHWSPDCTSRENGAVVATQHKHIILINVSPLEYGHILLVPSLTANQPQRVTMDGLKLALEMIMISRSSDFRVGFNSLCGYASVNHHHYHGYYLAHRLFIEYAELKVLAGSCLEFCDQSYPAPGFAFTLTEGSGESSNEVETFLSEAFTLISYLQENDIAHNIYITRGSSKCQPGSFDAIRLFVWARTPSYGSKACQAFNPALCELAGHFPIKNESSYETLTEDVISSELRNICQYHFNTVRKQVLSLFGKKKSNQH